MKLYFSPGACALGVQIVLREMQAKFDLVQVDLRSKKYADGDFYRISPKGYIPTLQLDNGEILTEGSVILQYLADQSSAGQLLPKYGSMERYRAMEWLNFIASELHKGFGVLFTPNLDPAAKKSFTDKLQGRLAFIDVHLLSHKYFLGSEFSAVDAYAYNVLTWSRPLHIDISTHKGILGFMERMNERPSVQAAIEAEGLKKKH